MFEGLEDEYGTQGSIEASKTVAQWNVTQGVTKNI